MVRASLKPSRRITTSKQSTLPSYFETMFPELVTLLEYFLAIGCTDVLALDI